MVFIKKPESAEEVQGYYDLRYRILRKPWKQPKGSEKDDKEDVSIHIVAVDGRNVVGVGRLHNNSNHEAQIRFMAVEEDLRGKGVGSMILKELEEEARKRGAKYIVMNARENAAPFYKKHGYRIVTIAHTLFGEIPHFRMRKDLKT